MSLAGTVVSFVSWLLILAMLWLRYFHLCGESGMLACKRSPLKGGCEEFVSAWARMGWLTRMAVIEVFGGCCHGRWGGRQKGSKKRETP